MIKKPELLAPAGCMASLEAAIEGGADAVYFGAEKFNARMRAGNFSEDELSSALSLCRAYGVRSYITLNTRLFDGELYDALKVAAKVYEDGADGIIVADMGLSRLISEYIPGLELHASTQLSGHSVKDAEVLHDAGFSRMVCHREITLGGLRTLCRKSPVEIEMFIHGAHCVSFSGQCLMSAVMGGRSGNRGECAQPCRQQYTLGKSKGYPLSLKDMCLAGHMTDIISSGVASLKIEGRQKPPEYVYGVVSVYRRLIDEGRRATEDEAEKLRELFSRGGFSDGYLTDDHKNMLGIRTMDEYLASDKTKFPGLTKKVPLDITLKTEKGKIATLTAKSPVKTVTVCSEYTPGDNITPLTEDGARKNVSRLGATPFFLDKFEFLTDGLSPLPLSEVNRMRRAAVSALLSSDRVMAKEDIPEDLPTFDGEKSGEKCAILTAEFLSEKTVTAAAREFFDEIYLPYGVENTLYGVSLPPYLPDGSWEKLSIDSGKKLLVHSASGVRFAKETGASVMLSMRGNVFNSLSAQYYANEGADKIILAPEMKLPKMRILKCSAKCGAVVYGRLPLMLTVRCAVSDGGARCSRHGEKNGEICREMLSDRRRATFPVIGMPDCTNVIYNSVPIYMADKKEELDRANITVRHFIFTTETAEEVDKVIKAFREGTAPERFDIRRMT